MSRTNITMHTPLIVAIKNKNVAAMIDPIDPLTVLYWLNIPAMVLDNAATNTVATITMVECPKLKYVPTVR